MPEHKKHDLIQNAENLGAATAEIAKTVASFAARKTKNVSRIAKLNVDIANERDTIKSAYREIGKLYYELHREAPERYFEQLCREIDVSMESIAAAEAEIARLKTQDPAAGEEETPHGEG